MNLTLYTQHIIASNNSCFLKLMFFCYYKKKSNNILIIGTLGSIQTILSEKTHLDLVNIAVSIHNILKKRGKVQSMFIKKKFW